MAIKVKKTSAGLLQYHFINGKLKLFLVHPAGPLFKKKDFGVWSIPKGGMETGETAFKTAVREFGEEVGAKPKLKNVIDLGNSLTRTKSKKLIMWAFEGNQKFVKSIYMKLEYPRNSGKFINIPENDKGQFFDIPTALKKINKDQRIFIERLLKKLKTHDFKKEHMESKVDKLKNLVDMQPKHIKQKMVHNFFKANGTMLGGR